MSLRCIITGEFPNWNSSYCSATVMDMSITGGKEGSLDLLEEYISPT